MGRSGLGCLTAMLAVAACSGRAGPAAESGPQQTRAAATPAPQEPGPDATVSARAAAPERAVESGLGVGQTLEAFAVVDAASGEPRCRICENAAAPTIIVAGTLGDPELEEDIKDVDAIVAKWGRDRVDALAVIALPYEGKLTVPEQGHDELAARVERLRELLDVSIPVVVPAVVDAGGNPVWEEHYNVTRSRTFMFADEHGEVRYSAIAPDHLGPLDQAIREALGS